MSTQNKVFLTDEQRGLLETKIRSGIHSARELARCRILLLADRSHGSRVAHPVGCQGKRHSDAQIAEAVGVCAKTVEAIRRRFVREGLQVALSEKPRPGRSPKITGDVEAQLTVLACSAPPEGQSHWTLRLMADRLVELECVDRISHTAVAKVLKKTNSSLGRSKPGA